MYEKILALLSGKFAQARKDGLQQLARSLALQADDENDVQALVDKLNDDKVTGFIKDWRKEVDTEVTSSTKKFESTLKSKFDLVEKGTPTPPADPNDISALVAQAVQSAISPLQQELSNLKAGKVANTRKEELSKLLGTAPASFKNPILKSFDKISFASDEEFESYKTETVSDFKAFEQELADKGLKGFITPADSTGNVEKVKVSKDIDEWAKKNAPVQK